MHYGPYDSADNLYRLYHRYFSEEFLCELDDFYNNAVLLGESCIEYKGLLLSKSAKGRWVLKGLTWDKDDVHSLPIPEFIEEIAPHAFEGYENLWKVDLPKNLKAIGAYAFAKCCSLSHGIEFPATLEKIGEHAFEYTKIGSILIPDKVKVIPACAFRGCTYATHVSIPCGIHLGNLCFAGLGVSYNSFCAKLEIRPFPTSKDSALERLIGPYATIETNVKEEQNPFYDSAHRNLIKVIHGLYIVKRLNVERLT